MRALRALVVTVVVLAGCTAPPHETAAQSAAATAAPFSPAERRRRIESYYREATELYAETTRLIAHTPASTKTALALSQSQALGGALIARELRYQAEIEAAPHAANTADPHLRSAQLELAGVDAFLSQSIHSVLQNCNRRDAGLDASVVRALIQEARRDLDGRPIPGWLPPDVSSKTNGLDECR